ncbi:MAG TPA: transposase [Mucilaginibacter sp.]|nr:transposase [Mucilaginibacter sp.]
MAVKTQHQTLDYNIWFITFTCHSWIRLFEIANSHDLVYNWLRLIDDKHGVKTAAFVIMPNHVHLLLHLTTAGIDPNKLIGKGKRFMAYAIVRRLAAGSPTGDPAGRAGMTCLSN